MRRVSGANRRSRFSRALLVSLCLLHPWRAALAAPDSLGAASPRPREPTPPALIGLLREFEEGTPLKMRSLEGMSYAGDLKRRNGEIYLVSFDRFDERRLLPEQVDRLWIQNGDRGNEGMLIGAGIGFVALSLLGASVLGGYAETSFQAVMASLSFGLFLGATPGAILGALFGRGIPEWELLYEAESALSGQPSKPPRE